MRAMGNKIGPGVLAVPLLAGSLAAAHASPVVPAMPYPVAGTLYGQSHVGHDPATPPGAAPSIHDIVTGDNPDQQITVRAAPVVGPAADLASDRGDEDGSGSPDRHAEVSKLPLGSMIDRELRSADRSTLGRVVDVLIGADGRVSAIVADVGGFLGVGNRKVAIAWSLVSIDHADPKGAVLILAPAGVIRSAPEYKPDDRDIAVVTGPRIEEKRDAGRGNATDKDAATSQGQKEASTPLGIVLVPTRSAGGAPAPGSAPGADVQKEAAAPHSGASPEHNGAAHAHQEGEQSKTPHTGAHRADVPHANAQ